MARARKCHGDHTPWPVRVVEHSMAAGRVHAVGRVRGSESVLLPEHLRAPLRNILGNMGQRDRTL